MKETYKLEQTPRQPERLIGGPKNGTGEDRLITNPAPNRITQSESKTHHENGKQAEILGKKMSLRNLNLETQSSEGGSEEKSSSHADVDSEDQVEPIQDVKIMRREKKSLNYLLKVRAEIQKELDLRVSNCRALKKRVAELATEHQKLLPKLDRIGVEHQSELEFLE